MPELATSTEAATEGSVTVAVPAKKTVVKPATKKVVKAVPVKAAPAASNGAAAKEKKSGLGKPQTRILKVLAKATKPLTRKEVSEKAQVDNAYCTSYLGSADEAVRAKNDKNTLSLYTMGMIKFGPKNEEGGGTTYVISAKGKTTADKL